MVKQENLTREIPRANQSPKVPPPLRANLKKFHLL